MMIQRDKANCGSSATCITLGLSCSLEDGIHHTQVVEDAMKFGPFVITTTIPLRYRSHSKCHQSKRMTARLEMKSG
eukprot:1161358-Pelagomonas_calceolata.AAC.6